MGRKTASLIWNTVDRCILLEDDILPSVSFFKYCAELLEKYKDDQRIECICGMNHLGISKDVNSDYFFARQGSIWGIATWKRAYAERYQFDYKNDAYIMKLLKQRTKHNPIAWKRLCAYAQSKYYEGHVAGSEFWIEFNMYAQNRLQIIPKKNLITNIGCTKDAAHSQPLNQLPRGIRRVFNMEAYELEFPLKHAEYVIPDLDYEKKRNQIMGYNRPVIKLFRKAEIFWIKIKSGQWSYFTKRIKKRISHEQREK